ncbi:MAG: FecR domain-containing protein [Bacteroidales bacterium]
MTLQKNNNNKIDQAWNRLQTRMEQDGLLNDKRPARQPIFSSVVLKWAASLVIFISATLFIILGVDNSKTEMLSLYNSEKNSSFVTTLEDGSVVYLAGNSSLSYPEHFKKRKREVFLKGDAFFEISKDGKSPFIVQADRIKIEVLGTSFNVKSSNNASPSLSVNTGEVKVTLREDGQTARLAAGETAIIHSGRLQTIPTHDFEQFSRYTDRMHFKDEQLSNVIRVINRNMDGVMLEISPGLEGRLITASFSGNSPETMAKLICIALNLKYSQQQNTIRIYE